MDNLGVYLLVAAVVLALVFVKKALVIIPQSETKIIERLGKFHAILKPGINIIIPFVDSAKSIVRMVNRRYLYSSTIDLREQVYDFDKQNVITKDNIQMQINALLYFQIVAPLRRFTKLITCPTLLRSSRKQHCVTSLVKWN